MEQIQGTLIGNGERECQPHVVIPALLLRSVAIDPVVPHAAYRRVHLSLMDRMVVYEGEAGFFPPVTSSQVSLTRLTTEAGHSKSRMA